MFDDVSAIPLSGCNVVSNQTTIYNYNNSIRKTFTQIGGKWIQTGESSYNYTPSGVICVDVSELSSNSAFIPIYYFISFSLILVLAYMLFLLIRKVTRWF